MHITNVSWFHDSVLALNDFVDQGLEIELDTVIDPSSLTRATMVVTIEIPQVILAEPDVALTSQDIPDTALILDGGITSSSNTIIWKPIERQIRRIMQYVANLFAQRGWVST